MKTRRRIPIPRGRRRGLAMLELVLYLPIMLFVMALMVNFGNMAAWKVRAQHNTRYAGWRTLQDRTGQYDPNPAHWPQPATLGTSGGRAMTNANAIWDRHPRLTTPVTRGPVIVEPDQGLTITVPGRFNMDATVHAGDARIRRKLPMLRKTLPNDGTYGFTEHQELLDNRWEYRHLRMPRNPYDRRGDPGDGGNRARRAKRWYRLDPPFFPRLQRELRRLAVADGRLKSYSARFDLDPLDRDAEFYYIRLRARLGISGPIPDIVPDRMRVPVPDFHPRARVRCDIDTGRVKSTVVDPLVNRIQHLPGRMGSAFASLYRGEIQRLQRLDPPPMAEIRALQEKLDQVQQFLGSLPRQYR
ncbi:MAG: hypothetical protein ACE5KM_24350 [Planctomycetaceae bacterium]